MLALKTALKGKTWEGDTWHGDFAKDVQSHSAKVKGYLDLLKEAYSKKDVPLKVFPIKKALPKIRRAPLEQQGVLSIIEGFAFWFGLAFSL